MSFRARLILNFAAISIAAIIVLTAITVVHSLRVFRANDAQVAEGVIAQLKHELESRGALLSRTAQEIAQSDAVMRIAAENDDAAHSSAASAFTQGAGVDYLELLRPDGTIISSAHWPARYGYKESNLITSSDKPFVARIETQAGEALALVAIRKATVGSLDVVVVVGSDLKTLLSDVRTANDISLWLYQSDSADLVSTSATASAPPPPAVISKHLSDSPNKPFLHGDHTYFMVPLISSRGVLTAYIVIGRSTQAQRLFVRSLSVSAMVATLVGLMVSVLLGTLLARRMTRPIEALAAAAENISEGDWHQRVDVQSNDEVGKLATSFNSMTTQLTAQRDRLVQVERVAAWRELARRLAHELKNPLFPLQLTLETLVKAKEMNAPEMDEIFRESTRTLHEEIGHLKAIVERFSDFSKMPTPEIQAIDVNELVSSAGKLHVSTLSKPAAQIRLATELDDHLLPAAADPVLLRRVIDNLVLNAIDAMPQGGTLTIRTKQSQGSVVIEVVDTGTGLTAEECERLFTPYYTTKQHGTGLGLAIVQSIISDHRGRISVSSDKGKGTIFRIELPQASAKAATR